MILLSRMDEKTYLHGFHKRVIEAILVSSLYRYPHGLEMVGFPLQSSLSREKEKKEENSQKACMNSLSCGRSHPIYKHFVGF